MIRKLLLAATCSLGLSLIPGCGTDGPVGKVRLVNATTAYTTMDLFADGDAVTTGVPVDSVSAYADVKEGSRVLSVRLGGAASDATTSTQSVSTDKHYSLVAYLSGTALTTQWLSDEEPAPSGNYAKLRVLNAASTQVGGVDVYLLPTARACATLGLTDTPVAAGVSGLQTAFASVVSSAGAGTSYNVCVTAAGSKSDVRLATPSVAFVNAQVATLILAPTTGGVLLNGFLLAQQGALTPLATTSARVRVVADAASAASVSVTLNGETFFAADTSPQLTDYQTIDAGSAAIGVFIDSVQVTAPTTAITAGGDYTLVVAGTSAAPSVALLTDDNSASTSTTATVKIRLVNGANGAGTANLLVNGLQVASNVALGAGSTYAQVAPSAAQASLTSRSGATTLFSATTQTLSANAVYTLFLLGDVGSGDVNDTTTASLLIQDH